MLDSWQAYRLVLANENRYHGYGVLNMYRVATCPGSPGNVLEFNFVLEIVLEIIKMGKCSGNQRLKKYFVLEIPV